MALGVSISVRVTHPVPDDELAVLRERLLSDCGLTADDFYIDGPLLPESYVFAMPVPDGSWYEANLYHAFWSPQYPRGDAPMYVRVAAWLEANFPGGTVWYGHDGSDDLRPFGPEARAELLASWEVRADEHVYIRGPTEPR